MATKRILFALELGANWGHLARSLPIALALRERGYEVCFTVSDKRTAQHFLQPHGLPFSATPELPTPPADQRGAGADSYAGVLMANGYGTVETLQPMVARWLSIFESVNPAVIVADFAPGAMLAARVASRAVVAIGLGFELPPPTYPLPSFRNQPVGSAIAVEDSVLQALNSVLTRFSAEPLQRLHELFPRPRTLLLTFPELDHYGTRSEGVYTGPIHCSPAGARDVRWPRQARRPRLLAYLRGSTAGLDAMLVAMARLGTTIACVPGRPPRSPLPAGAGHVHAQALQLEHLLPEADLVVANGNLTTSTRALLAGTPVLAMPNTMEQQLGAVRIAELGAGLMVAGDKSESTLSGLLQQALLPSIRTRAREFAERYAHESVSKAVARVVAVIEGAVSHLE